MMRPGLANKIIAVILISGFSIGSARSWHRFTTRDANAEYNKAVVEIPLLTSRTKANWIVQQIFQFDVAHPAYHVVPKYIESRDAMQAVTGGSEKPVLWCPESPVWAARADELWNQKHGQHIIDMQNPETFRVTLQTPMVFLTTRKKAEFLRPILGGSHPWSGIRKMSLSKRSVPWGRLRFSHADPISASSGMLTLAMILHEYAQTISPGTSVETLPNDPGFLQYLADIEGAMVFDAGSSGTYDLTHQFVTDPSSRDFIVTHESAALDAALANPNLVVIYPNPTTVADESVCLVNGPWVTPQQREGAQQFMTFLNGSRSVQDGLKSNMRPVHTTNEISLDGKLNASKSQGFQSSYESMTLPSYSALNTLGYRWHERFAVPRH